MDLAIVGGNEAMPNPTGRTRACGLYQSPRASVSVSRRSEGQLPGIGELRQSLHRKSPKKKERSVAAGFSCEAKEGAGCWGSAYRGELGPLPILAKEPEIRLGIYDTCERAGNDFAILVGLSFQPRIVKVAECAAKEYQAARRA